MPAGRPPKLVIDPDLQSRIVGMVKAGAFPDRAAVACGVGERSHYLWQAKGLEEREHREAGKTPRKTWQVYLDYLEQIEQAIAVAEIALMADARVGGPAGDAAMKLLQLRFRDRWSAKGTGEKAPTTAQAAAAQAGVTPLAKFAERRGQRRGNRGPG